MMKQKLKSLIIPLLISASANVGAEIVQATGYGNTFEEALYQSKLEALQKVVGTFIISDRELKDGKIVEDSLEYHGGYIKSYEIIEYDRFLNSVTISADVQVKKDNTIIVNGSEDVDSNLNNWQEKRAIMQKLDNSSNALVFTIDNINTTPDIYSVSYNIKTTLLWQPKWVSDVETFISTSNVEGTTSTDLSGRIGSGVVNSVGFNVVGGLLSTFLKKDIKSSDRQMICFTKYKNKDIDSCYDASGGFINIPRYSEMKVKISGYGIHDNLIYEQTAYIPVNKMYDNIMPGQSKKYMLVNRTFHQSTYIINKKEFENYTFNIKVGYNMAKQLKTFKIEPE